MKTNIAALSAALAVFWLTGMGAGSAPAQAEESNTTAAVTAKDTDTEKYNRERAKEATDDATSEAVDRIIADTKLELDIQLIGRTSKAVAARR